VLFAHVAKSRGAREVVGVDRVDRTDVAERFGIDRVVLSDTRAWAAGLDGDERPDTVVDAIGHRQEHVSDAVEALAPGGELVVFGLPEDHYVFPMRTFFRKGLTMWGGSTQDWTRYLDEAGRYLLRHREMPASYITDVYGLDRATEAYLAYAMPRAGRLKIALTPPAGGF
jgi:threonine dehydrogenase-like Zn-dependent dehydrogenase